MYNSPAAAAQSFKELDESTGVKAPTELLDTEIWGKRSMAAERLLNLIKAKGVNTKNSFLVFRIDVSGWRGPDLMIARESPKILVPRLPVPEGLVGLVETDARSVLSPVEDPEGLRIRSSFTVSKVLRFVKVLRRLVTGEGRSVSDELEIWELMLSDRSRNAFIAENEARL